MLSSDETKSIGKSGQRNRKRKQQSGKTAELSRKSVQEENSKPDQLQAAQEQVSTGSSESYSTDNALAGADQAVAFGQELQEDQEQVSIPVASHESYASDDTHTDDPHVHIEKAELAASADPMPVSFQSLAKAYEDYARNSFEQSRLFVEKLASVRSLDSALELQTDFVKHACEAFIAETQKIRDIHRGLAKQRLAYLEQFAARMTPIALMPPASRN